MDLALLFSSRRSYEERTAEAGVKIGDTSAVSINRGLASVTTPMDYEVYLFTVAFLLAASLMASSYATANES